MSYRDLDVYCLAKELSIGIHKMSMSLPKHELYETGSQIRRSSKSIRSNIVEGYGRRRYKAEFVRFLTFAHASCDETSDHLDCLKETGSLAHEETYEALRSKCDELGRKLNRFIQAVVEQHQT